MNAPFNSYFVGKTSNCVTVRPVMGHLTPKMNIAFFIRNLILNIFLFKNFFEKSCIFRETRKKVFWGRIWIFFRERRRLTLKINITFLSQMRYRIFYYLPVFSKMCNFLRKRRKTVSGAQVSFVGKEASGDENEYKLFHGKMRSRIFYRLTIFSKKATFLEIMEKKFWADMTIF